jgi:hypothetical protein
VDGLPAHWRRARKACEREGIKCRTSGHR